MSYSVFGLTSAQHASPAAFLGSMAAVAAAPVFAPYSQPGCPLPSSSLLHHWITDRMAAVLATAPGGEELLLSSASTFFQHFAPRPSSSTAKAAFVVQHELSLQATASAHSASLQRDTDMRRVDGGRGWRVCELCPRPRRGRGRRWPRRGVSSSWWTPSTASPLASTWTCSPRGRRRSYRTPVCCALVIGHSIVSPLASTWACSLQVVRQHCPTPVRCAHVAGCSLRTRGPSCPARSCRRGRSACVTTTSAACSTAVRCPWACERIWRTSRLDPKSGLQPDLLFMQPGRRILMDVAICHLVAASAANLRQQVKVKQVEARKMTKYTAIGVARLFEQLHFVAETCSGLSASAVKLIQVIAQASEEHLAVWSREDVVRQLPGAVAIAVQREGAMMHLEGYDRCMHAMNTRRAVARAELSRRQGASRCWRVGNTGHHRLRHSSLHSHRSSARATGQDHDTGISYDH